MTEDDEPQAEIIADPVPTFDAADPRQVQARHDAYRRKKDKAAIFWRLNLADPVGRAVLWELFSSEGLWRTEFACGPAGFPDPFATWFALGRKDVVERLYRHLLRIDHNLVHKMHEEHDPNFQKPVPARKET